MERFSVEVFGERLRQRRRDRGLTQQAIAQQLSVAQGWISELENAQQGPAQANTLYRLCQALDVSADYLLGLTDDPTPWKRRRRKPPER